MTPEVTLPLAGAGVNPKCDLKSPPYAAPSLRPFQLLCQLTFSLQTYTQAAVEFINRNPIVPLSGTPHHNACFFTEIRRKLKQSKTQLDQSAVSFFFADQYFVSHMPS